jgi:preprotein translocase subunit SecD
MKKVNYIFMVMLVALFSCNSAVKTNSQKVTFGIYTIAKSVEIPQSAMDTLKSKGVLIENGRQPVMGYVEKSDSMALRLDLSGQNFKLLKTADPVDKDQKYCAVVEVGTKPFIDNADIEKVKASGNQIEIDFNYNGAKKWADFTKKNIGNWVAFVVNGRVYSMPLINGEIKSGIAIISGFKDEVSAKNMAALLNASISN